MDKPINNRGGEVRKNDMIFSWQIGSDKSGDLMEKSSGVFPEKFLTAFSKMKYGHTDSVDYLSRQMVDCSIKSTSLLDFVRQAKSEDRTVFITSPAIMNLPSGSNLLLKAVTRQLNVHLTEKGFSPVILLEQTKIKEPNPNYSESTPYERQSEMVNSPVYVPTIFKDNYVIFIDDIYITGTTIESARDTILNSVGAKDIYFVLAARIDKDTIDSLGADLEAKLNRYAVDESMPSLINLVKEGCEPTQKMLRLFFESKNSESLDLALETLTVNEIRNLYELACQNGFQVRWNGICAESMNRIRSFLAEITNTKEQL